MAQPATIIDAPSGDTQRHGSQQVTFSGAGTLIAEDISYRKGTRAIRSTNEVGKPLKAAYVPEWGDGSMTVQLKTATDRLTAGQTGSFYDTDGSTVISFIVTEVGVEYRQNDSVKVPIKISEKIN
ncbi:MAG: hypothetical protein QOE26_2757 [Verrucomicrobiota bacterium]|jgi:hypothetical protein